MPNGYYANQQGAYQAAHPNQVPQYEYQQPHHPQQQQQQQQPQYPQQPHYQQNQQFQQQQNMQVCNMTQMWI